jgi:WD40 repeat protein
MNDNLAVYKSTLSSVAFSTDGKYLASSSYDKTIKLLSIELQRELSVLRGHKD